MKILISPYSQKLRSGKRNAKNYPYWTYLIKRLKQMGHYVIQIGVTGEEKFQDVDDFKVNMNFKTLEKLVESVDVWVSVDNFFPHFCNSINSYGIVIFSKSDPLIFGYDKNINLLKDRNLLRPDQFGIWDGVEYDMISFIDPEIVIKEILNFKK